MSQSPFISVAELAGFIAAGTGIVLDVRHRHGPNPAPLYPGKIAGARPVEIATFVGQVTPTSGNGPLPEPGTLAARLAEWGIGPDTDIVVYGDADQSGAARAWAVLAWAGYRRVRVLDGGIEAWAAADLPLGSAIDERAPIEVPALAPSVLVALDAADAAALAPLARLADTRGKPAYDGDAAVANTGHIPNALNLPASKLFSESGKVRPGDEIRAAIGEAGLESTEPPGLYCGGGFAAARAALALRHAGIDSPVYFGSWSHWISDPARPQATTQV